MADTHLSHEQRIAQEQYDQYLEDYSEWYDMLRGHIVVAVAAHTVVASAAGTVVSGVDVVGFVVVVVGYAVVRLSVLSSVVS